MEEKTYYLNGYTPDDEDHELTVDAVNVAQAKARARARVPGLTVVDCINLNEGD